MLYAVDFRKRAREALKNNWGKAVGVGILASLLGVGTTSMGGVTFNFDLEGISQETANWSIDSLDNFIPKQYQIAFVGIVSFLFFITVVVSIVWMVISGAITLGYVKFNLNLIDGKQAEVSDLFSEFKRLGTAFVMQFLRSLYIILWTFVFIIPGIIASYSYAMAPYILLENQGMTGREAIAKSKELMKGNRLGLFCLEMSFFGWNLLCIMLTFGIGYLWIIPYQQASFATFYREIWREKYGWNNSQTYEAGYNSQIKDSDNSMDKYNADYRYRTDEEEERRYDNHTDTE